jgi:hypothetical protein
MADKRRDRRKRHVAAQPGFKRFYIFGHQAGPKSDLTSLSEDVWSCQSLRRCGVYGYGLIGIYGFSEAR